MTRQLASVLKRTLIGSSDVFYRLRNRRRPRVLVYSDSRGLNFLSRLGKSGSGTYAWLLRRNFLLTYVLCPEKYTTLIDFIEFVEHVDASSFDAVICHCGIVDFSPRPLSSLEELRNTKAQIQRFDELFRSNDGYYQRPFEQSYAGEATINLYSKDFLVDQVIPRLQEIPRLIWINSNQVLPDWKGNYHRDRPVNLNEVVTNFDSVVMAALPNYVDLRDWSRRDVKRYTIDNVHLSQDGFGEVARRVEAAISSMGQHPYRGSGRGSEAGGERQRGGPSLPRG